MKALEQIKEIIEQTIDIAEDKSMEITVEDMVVMLKQSLEVEDEETN